ncbi:MAG TPA: protein kinase [Gemmatimonadaceae bacterium]|jgi:serine/threonine-protein kinase
MTTPADDDLSARLGRALAPAYEIESELGRGGMAIVYRGRDTRLKRGVAVKLLPPDLAFRADIRSRFLREAETAARLSHPNIVQIYTVDERDGLVYFVMALIHGESVGDRLRRTGAMPVDESRRILTEVAAALAVAHANGVVHRDIKPDNILLDEQSGRAVVTDFGIARAAGDDVGGSRLTATGAAIGTPAYMSPEQCVGDRDIDGRSDLYSLGAVAYQMLTGEPPFSGANTPSIMMKQVTEAPLPIRVRRPDVPEDLERIVMRLLEKDPAARFADGGVLVDALNGAPVEPARGSSVPRSTVVSNAPAAQPAPSAPAYDSYDYDTRLSRREERALRRARKRGPMSTPDRLRRARNKIVSYVGTSAMLFGINAMTGGGFWWCIFPILAMGAGLSKELGSFWADGIPIRAIFSGVPPTEAVASGLSAPALASPASTTPTTPTANATNTLSAPEPNALSGPHAEVLRQAIVDRRNIIELVSRFTRDELAMVPDVKGTAEALYQRIVSLAAALNRLDGNVDERRGAELDERIRQIEQQTTAGGERERRLGLLRRQREMIDELTRSRASLVEQYESAGILLQNLALDLLKMRSSGIDSALSGLTSATQEARALSREIGYVLHAADELRDLEGKGDTAV